MCIKLQSLKAFPTDWFSIAEPEHLNTGADADEITGQTQLASLRPCVRKGRWREVRRIYRRCVGERFTTTVGQTESGSKRRRWSVLEKRDERGLSCLIITLQWAIFQPSTCRSSLNTLGTEAPLQRASRIGRAPAPWGRGLLIAPNTNANGAQLYWLAIKDSHQPLLQIKGTVQRMSSAYTNCYKTPFSNQFSYNCLQFMKIPVKMGLSTLFGCHMGVS